MPHYTLIDSSTNEILSNGFYESETKFSTKEGETLLENVTPPPEKDKYNPDTKEFYSSNSFLEDKIRKERDQLLSATDWTQVGDSTHPGSKADWLAYRTALRDITKQEGFPSSVTWPTPPE